MNTRLMTWLPSFLYNTVGMNAALPFLIKYFLLSSIIVNLTFNPSNIYMKNEEILTSCLIQYDIHG